MNRSRAPAAPAKSQTAGWTTNTTIEEVAQRLRAAKRVALFTHSRPDGDAVGSTLATARALRLVGVDATPLYAGPWSHRFDAVVADTKTLRIGGPEQIPKLLGGRKGEPDMIVVMDTGSWAQLVEAKPWLAERTDRVVVVDHHLHGDPDLASMRVIDTTAAAVAQPAAELCRLLLGKSHIRELPLEIATPLYLGVATDTGWFKHSNVTARVFHIAAALLEAGVNHAALYQQIEQSDKPARLQIMERALRSLRLHAADRAAVMSLSKRDFAETGADIDDAGGLSDLPMTVQTVRVSAVLTALEDSTTKVSLRSKWTAQGPNVDVNLVARELGGGGHAQAAGAKIGAPLEEATRRVVEAMTKAFG